MSSHKVVGIDYSITCPCACVYAHTRARPRIKFDHTEVKYWTSKEKFSGSFGNIKGALNKREHDTRYMMEIADSIIGFMYECECDPQETSVYIEGYSYGGSGQVFNIAEHTGILKARLTESNFQFSTFAPTTIKKNATGKGNASKQEMYECFLEREGLNLKNLLCETEKAVSPSSDIIDSFEIVRLAICLNTHEDRNTL